MKATMRVARPVRDIQATANLYCAGLGLHILGKFEDHAGFDGVMLGRAGMDYHFEFTFCHTHTIAPSPTEDDLIVFYLPDADEWEKSCTQMDAAGFTTVPSFNPYWDVRGRTFADPDGYRIVLQNASWVNVETSG